MASNESPIGVISSYRDGSRGISEARTQMKTNQCLVASLVPD